MPTTIERRQQASLALSLRIQLAVAFFAFILIGANDGAFGVLLPSIGTHYQTDKATLATLFLFSTAGYLVAAFNSGLLLEKLGRRLFLVLGGVMFTLSTIIVSLMPPFTLLLFLLFPLGFGIAILDAGLNAYIAGLPRNATLLNYLHAFYGIGALLGPLVASTILALSLGWNSVYTLWTLVGTIVLVGIAWTFRARAATTQEVQEKTGGNVFLMALRARLVWLAALFLLFYVGTEVSLGSWTYSFLTEERHGALLISGWIVSGYWLGLTVGRLTLAQAVQRVGERRMIELCLAGVAAGLLLTWLVPNTIASAIGLCLTGFCLGPIFPTTIALMPKLVPSRLVPSAIGFLTSLGSMGAALFPWAAGHLVQAVGLWALLPYAIGLTICMLLFWLLLQLSSRTARG